MLNHIVEYNPVTTLGSKLFGHSKLLSDISTFFSKLFINGASINTERFLFAIGLASLTYKLALALYNQYKFWKWMPSHISNTSNFSPEKLK